MRKKLVHAIGAAAIVASLLVSAPMLARAAIVYASGPNTIVSFNKLSCGTCSYGTAPLETKTQAKYTLNTNNAGNYDDVGTGIRLTVWNSSSQTWTRKWPTSREIDWVTRYVYDANAPTYTWDRTDTPNGTTGMCIASCGTDSWTLKFYVGYGTFNPTGWGTWTNQSAYELAKDFY
jgi:hypothetical protein